MSSISLLQMCDAIRDQLQTAIGAANSVAFSADELRDGISDNNTLQVYPDGQRQDAGGQTDRTTFGAKVRQTGTLIYVDYYAKQRANLGEDMGALVAGIDAIVTVLETNDRGPAFGLAGIKQFAWSWKRVLFTYGDPNVKYIGARFTITLRTY